MPRHVKPGVYVRVVNEYLARRAIEGTGFRLMQKGMVWTIGPRLLATGSRLRRHVSSRISLRRISSLKSSFIHWRQVAAVRISKQRQDAYLPVHQM